MLKTHFINIHTLASLLGTDSVWNALNWLCTCLLTWLKHDKYRHISLEETHRKVVAGRFKHFSWWKQHNISAWCKHLIKTKSFFLQHVIPKQISQKWNTNRPLLLCKYGKPIMVSDFLLDIHLSQHFTQQICHQNLLATKIFSTSFRIPTRGQWQKRQSCILPVASFLHNTIVWYKCCSDATMVTWCHNSTIWHHNSRMNNYIVRSYRDVIVITQFAIRRASKAQRIVMY